MEYKLNKQQEAAIQEIDGSTLVVASPGTGKTQVLASRIAKMLTSDQGIDPYMILALTFTEAGVKAMRERLLKFIGVEAYKLNIATFHGFCNEIIQTNPDYFGIRDFEPVSELEKIEIAYQIINEMKADNPLKRLRGDIYYDSKRLLNLFQMMKDENYTEEILELQINEWLESLPENEDFIYKRANKKKNIELGDPKQHLIDKETEKMNGLLAAIKLFPRYNELLKAKGRYDYSDMLKWVLDAWNNDDFFLLTYQERYQYVLIDEYQDTNRVQFDLVVKLMDFWDNPNIFAVADEDQVLFEFCGARMQNVIDFVTKYKSGVNTLIQNYRSTNQIIDSAKRVVKLNNDRLTNILPITKEMYSPNKGEGSQPKVLSLETPEMETSWIFEYIKNHLDNGYDISNIGVIYRKHSLSDDLIRQLEAEGIPYNIKRSINVLDTAIIKQYMTIIKYLSNYHDLQPEESDMAFFKLLHYPFFGNDITEIHEFYITNKEEPPQSILRTEEILRDCVEQMVTQGIVTALNAIIQKTGMIEHLVNQSDYYKQIQYLNTFFGWIKGEAAKDRNLDFTKLVGLIDKMEDNGIWIPTVDVAGFSKGVNLLTAHGSKGLEFDKVIIMGANRNHWEAARASNDKFSLPPTITMSVTENKLESARRLFYVAMTRAENELVITYPKTNSNSKPLEPTQFITEAELPIEDAFIDMNKYILNSFAPSILEMDILESAIKDKLSSFSMSVSSLNKYLRCPLTFYFENIVRVPFVASPALISGNAVHIALKEAYDTYKEVKSIDREFIIKRAMDYLERNRAQLDDNAIKSAKLYVTKVLTNALGSYFENSNKIVLTEYKIKRMIIDGVPIKGDIDKIEFEGNLAILDDYKTGNSTNAKKKLIGPTDKDPNGGDYWRQKVLYKMMFDRLPAKEWTFNGFRLDILTPDEVIMIPEGVTSEEEMFVTGQLKDAYESIMALRFNQCEDPECVWCKLISNK